MSDIKQKCKENRVTFNDFLVAMISLTMKQYFLEKGDAHTDRMLLFMPFNTRTSLPSKDDRTLANHLAGYPYPLPLFTSPELAFAAIHRDLIYVKSRFLPLGSYYLTALLVSFPSHLASALISYFAGKPTLTMTNVFGPPHPVKLCGSKSLRVYALLPSMAEISGGFALVSHCEVAKVSFIADTKRCSDASRVIELFERNIE